MPAFPPSRLVRLDSMPVLRLVLTMCAVCAACAVFPVGAASGESAAVDPAADLEQRLATMRAALALGEVEQAESAAWEAHDAAHASADARAVALEDEARRLAATSAVDLVLARLRAEPAAAEGAEGLEALRRAVDELPRDLARSPDSLELRQRLARSQLRASAEASDERFADALATLRFAAELGPLDRDLALVLAVLERGAGRLPASNRQLRSLAERFGSTSARVLLAHGAADLGREKLAVQHARSALDAAPSSTVVQHLVVRTGLEAGLAPAVMDAALRLADRRPDDAEALTLLGRAYAELGDMSEASEALLRAVALDPSRTDARRALALALVHEARFDEARGHLERLLEPESDLEVVAVLAEVEERLGDAESAEARALRVLEEAPERSAARSRVRYVLGMLRAGEQRFEEARAELEASIESSTAPPRAHYQLSFVCSRLRDRACAEEHLAIYRAGLEASSSALRVEQAPVVLRKVEPSKPDEVDAEGDG